MKSITQVFQNLLKPYIDRKDRATQANIAPVETDATSASQAYAEGAQLILNDVLYDVTAAITQGDALVVNTNIAAADDITTQIKNHTVTTDPVPTQNSTNPVQSGGVYTADANEAATRSAMGAKNLIPYPYYNGDSRDTNGILFTVNSDGSITISGEATADAYFRLTYTTGDIHIQLVSGKSYILSASGKADVAILLRDDSSSNVAVARGADATFDCTTSGNFDVIILVENGAVYTTPVTVYPMLRLATDANGDYHPYAKTNKELTDEVSSVKSAFTNNVNQNGCKNILDFPYTDSWTHTAHQITFSTNTNGSVTASGTNTDGSRAFCALVMGKTLKAGKYVISKGTTSSNSQMRVRNSVSVSTIYAEISSSTEHAEFTLLEDTVVDIEIMTSTNAVVSNLVFYPMLCFASDYAANPEWQSPTKTNLQLTADTNGLLDNMMDNGAVNLLENSASSYTDPSGEVTWTVNDDGTVTAVVNQTITATRRLNNVFSADRLNALLAKFGTLKLTGSPSGSIDLYGKYSDDTYFADNRNGIIIDRTHGNVTQELKLQVKVGTTPQTFVIKPMLSVPSLNLSYDDYVPYAKTNKELTDDVAVKELTFTDFFTLASGYSLSHQVLRKVANGYSIQATIQGSLNIGRNAVATMSTVIGTATEETIFGSGRCLDSNATYHPVSVGMPIKANAELSVYTDTAITNGYCTFSMIIPF